MKKLKYVFLGLVSLIIYCAPAFSQYIQVTPDSIDLGNIPADTSIPSDGESISGRSGVFSITNISDSVILIFPPVVLPDGNIGENVYRPFHLSPGQTWYGCISLSSIFVGSSQDSLLIWYNTPLGRLDSVIVPIRTHSFQASAPFMTSVHFGTLLVPACDPGSPYATVLGFISAPMFIINSTAHTLEIDSIHVSGDTGTLGFQIPNNKVSHTGGKTLPTLINEHNWGDIPVLFHSSYPGMQQARVRVYYSYADTTIAEEQVMDSVLTGYTQYGDAVIMTGDIPIASGHQEDMLIIDTPTVVGHCSTPGSQTDFDRASISIYNFGTVGHCGDSITFHLDFVGARKDAFSVINGPATFTLPSISESGLKGGGANIQYCPKVPAYHVDSNEPDGYVYDSVRVIADYADGTHDTSYMKIATHTPVVSGVAEPVPPGAFTLHNYPNPFTNATHIAIDAPLPADARVIVTDMLGRQVADLGRTAGARELEWTPEPSVPSGTYFLIVKTPARETAKLMLLMR
jgi:hypothetical protein